MEAWLEDLLKDDEFGLLAVKPRAERLSADDRLLKSFEEINQFVDKHKRVPQMSSDVLETSLFYRLEGIRDNEAKIKQLASADRHSLLPKEIKEKPTVSMEDILADDDLGLLAPKQEDIFDLKHGLKPTKPAVHTYDYVAQRHKCDDFAQFEPLFKACQADLACGKRKLKKFTTETSITPGHFFVYKGVLLYIAAVGKEEERNQRRQARLRCIYENGTESDLLRNSLAKAMYADGKIVSDNIDDMMNELANINEEDKAVGYVYVLRSLSRDPQVKQIKDLYKIGYSNDSVENRIKNAANETTYLMAPVKVVATYKIYNVNTQKFEDLLHKFFDSAKLSIDVIDNNGTRHTVREWFQVPFSVIQEAVYLLGTGKISGYVYIRDTQSIEQL